MAGGIGGVALDCDKDMWIACWRASSSVVPFAVEAVAPLAALAPEAALAGTVEVELLVPASEAWRAFCRSASAPKVVSADGPLFIVPAPVAAPAGTVEVDSTPPPVAEGSPPSEARIAMSSCFCSSALICKEGVHSNQLGLCAV